ncbi:MAG: metal-dependent hydrolase [Syntrophorhabdus sp. PtaU1.Bin153]|nr:MAG: metal-dependent hydrolase [Syntrophorhabdus sp. PtaU1.Bin153]
MKLRLAVKIGLGLFFLFLVLGCFLPLAARVTEQGAYTEKVELISDHFDGFRYFNPEVPETLPSPSSQAARWIWNRIFRTNWSEWPNQTDFLPGVPPVAHGQEGSLRVTPVGHGTFLIQLDGVNILTDPMWSERCSPLSWVGPKRVHQPGIRFDDLPRVDAVLISHNHYDHLDLPTLERLAKTGMPRAIVPLGNRDLVRSSEIPMVHELDWWQSVRLSSNVTITLVPARHYSSRTPWDRNRSLWGGFIISGQSGNVFYSGDTGYGPHFREIALRFAPIRVALLPIAPFHARDSEESQGYRQAIHMGPTEAVKAHIDLGTPVSIAAHFRVFQLGLDGFNDAVDVLSASLKDHHLRSDAFVVPMFGQTIDIPPAADVSLAPACEVHSIGWRPFGTCPPQYRFAEGIIPLSQHVARQTSCFMEACSTADSEMLPVN